MRIRWYQIMALSALALTMFTCDNAGSDGYSFIDQDLQGKIGGVTWKWEGTENGGIVEEALDSNLDIEIYGIAAASGDPCHPLAFEATSYKVSLTITVAPVDAVGLYEG